MNPRLVWVCLQPDGSCGEVSLSEPDEWCSECGSYGTMRPAALILLESAR